MSLVVTSWFLVLDRILRENVGLSSFVMVEANVAKIDRRTPGTANNLGRPFND